MKNLVYLDLIFSHLSRYLNIKFYIQL